MPTASPARSSSPALRRWREIAATLRCRRHRRRRQPRPAGARRDRLRRPGGAAGAQRDHPPGRAAPRRPRGSRPPAQPTRTAIVVYDVPLLVESANEYPFDLVVVAHADAAHAHRPAGAAPRDGRGGGRAPHPLAGVRRGAAGGRRRRDRHRRHARRRPCEQVDELWERLRPTAALRDAGRSAVSESAPRVSVVLPRLEACNPRAPSVRSRSSANTRRVATSRRPSPSSPGASTRARPTSCSSERPVPASRRRPPG